MSMSMPKTPVKAIAAPRMAKTIFLRYSPPTQLIANPPSDKLRDTHSRLVDIFTMVFSHHLRT